MFLEYFKMFIILKCACITVFRDFKQIIERDSFDSYRAQCSGILHFNCFQKFNIIHFYLNNIQISDSILLTQLIFECCALIILRIKFKELFMLLLSDPTILNPIELLDQFVV